jgi:UDP-N-acetylmuramoyl-tripeptide--D-alanyl-D-alanine ligase
MEYLFFMDTIKKIYKVFQSCRSVNTDTRIFQPNSIFFALKGENFDGNQFVEKAIERGYIAAVTSEKRYSNIENVFYVPDTLKALQDLANLHRRTLNIPIIAITGTNGKTTTKELLSVVLAQKYRVAHTRENKNNHIGVPLTLLSMNHTVDIGIIEMGANNIGEIDLLCKIAEPNYGLITNVGKAHLQGFGSIEGVKKTKKELYDYLIANNGTIFNNIDNPILTELLNGHTSISYGEFQDAFCKGEYKEFVMQAAVKWECKEKNNNGLAKSNLIGSYNFENILAAITIGCYFDVPEMSIDIAIASYLPRNNRSQLLKTSRNLLILDYYNANPTSMIASLKNFININEKNKALILGDMLELGNDSYEEHKKLLNYIDSLDLKNVFLVGDNFFKFRDFYEFNFFSTVDDLAKNLVLHPEIGKLFLVKGSRGIKLEKCIDYL